jgi:hypothetical protein
LNRKKSSFSVPGILDVETQSFKNPVIGEEQDTKIQLPKGWKLAEAAKTTIMCITTPSLNYDHSGLGIKSKMVTNFTPVYYTLDTAACF